MLLDMFYVALVAAENVGEPVNHRYHQLLSGGESPDVISPLSLVPGPVPDRELVT